MMKIVDFRHENHSQYGYQCILLSSFPERIETNKTNKKRGNDVNLNLRHLMSHGFSMKSSGTATNIITRSIIRSQTFI